LKPNTLRSLSSLLLLVLVGSALGQRGLPSRGGSASWSHDGESVVYQGKWYEPKSWQERKAKPRPAAPARPSEAEFRKGLELITGKSMGRSGMRGDRPRGTLPRAPIQRPGSRMSKDRNRGAAIVDGVLYAWQRGKGVRRLGDGYAGVRFFQIAPNGESISFIHENDLYITDLANGKRHRLTDNGSEDFFNGELDWVYQEEVYGRGQFNAAWWAPTGSHLTYMRIDETGVDTFTVVDHIPDALAIEHIKYPKAGTTNPRATLQVASAKDGRVTDVDLSKYRAEDEILIVRVGWTPSGDRIVFMVQNREQTWLDLNFADPKTGKSTTILRESNDSGWVDRLPMPRWLEDGSFLWESDRTGYRHYYRYDRQGKLLATVSRGEWSARSVIRLDEELGKIAFSGHSEDYWIGLHAYVATLDGKHLQRVTKGRGRHVVSFNKDMTMLLDSYQHMENPGEQWLRSVEIAQQKSEDLRQIYARPVPKGAEFPQWVRFEARDGEPLDLVYTKPAKFDPTKKYPIWISTYSGPAAPSVHDRYRGTGRGSWYVQLSVNVRSATTRGMKYTTKCYKQFGVQEVKDLEDAVDWLCDEHAWADKTRVGITGWSFGGTMTAFAMTHSDYFRCGIAGAGVYDWRLYDTIYTERFMATPQNNPKGYDLSSCIKNARNLKGQLLIVHGTMDDNVHMQNAIQFVHALQQAGKTNFELMLYPKARHGVRSRHLSQLREQFKRKWL
jgi:dipeptidyl-peptidase-4